MPSLVAKLLAGPQVELPTNRSHPEMVWTVDDIALSVQSGDLRVDPTERVALQSGQPPVSMARAYCLRFVQVLLSDRTVTPAVGPASKESQELLLDLIRKGNLSDQEIRSMAGHSLRAGAEQVFLALSSEWSRDERLEFLSQPGQVYVAGRKLSLLQGALHAGLHSVVRMALAEGWDPNSTTVADLTAAHLVSLPDILPDLKRAGLDPNALNQAGLTGPGAWSSMGLTATLQKPLAKAWEANFAAQIDPQQAAETLLSGLGAKTKAVMVNQLKAANLRPSDQVDGRFLVDHASYSLLMGDQVPKSGAALMWLLDQVPEHARHESAWRLHVALRFNQQFWSDQHKDLNP